MDEQPGVDPVAEAALSLFGIPYLFPFQRLVIGNVLESIDTHAASEAEETEDLHDRQIVILPTGAGKSLCFQIPARMRPGLTVVLFPLLSLMADQERRLQESGFKPAVLSGATGIDGKRKLWQRLAREPEAMLLTNPESTLSPIVRRRLKEVGISHLVIDEAHCVTDWGESFRPAYRSLASLIDETDPTVVTAFTATASPRILDDLRGLLFPAGAHVIQADPDRPNITYTLLPTYSKQRSLRLLYPAAAPPGEGEKSRRPLSEDENLPTLSPGSPAPLPSILFCRSRKEAERTAAYLRRILPPERCYFYHAGLSREEKKRVEQWFYSSDDGVLAATCAYGMGVDKKDIKSVIHLRPSSSVESYLQESGRGGRDGSPAQAALILAPSDIATLEATSTGREASYLQSFLTAGCRREALLEAMGAASDSCSGCDLCNDAEATAEVPALRFRRPWSWPALNGHSLASTLCGYSNPSVRELGSFLSPYWNACPTWKLEELKEAVEERRIAERLAPDGLGVGLYGSNRS